MAAERSPGGKVRARRITDTKRRAAFWEWVNEEFWWAVPATLVLTVIIAMISFSAAHLVFWVRHLW